MVLVIDVGNTNITFGVYDGKKLKTTFRLMAKTPRTSDEYGVLITELLSKNDIERGTIDGTIVASVVPNIMHSLIGGIKRYISEKLLLVGAGVKTGIKIVTENPKEIGPDRIVDAVAAYELYGGPVLGRIRQSFPKSRLKNRLRFSRRKPYPVCRQGLSTDKSDRLSILYSA